MEHVRTDDVPGERADAPYSRTLKHLAAPWTMGTEHLWVGMSEIDPGSRSNRHSHPNEEVFFVVAGRGRAVVDTEEVDVGPGSVVLVPSGETHQLVNTGDEPLQVLCSAAPAFDKRDFEVAHLLAPGE